MTKTVYAQCVKKQTNSNLSVSAIMTIVSLREKWGVHARLKKPTLM